MKILFLFYFCRRLCSIFIHVYFLVKYLKILMYHNQLFKYNSFFSYKNLKFKKLEIVKVLKCKNIQKNCILKIGDHL